MELNRRAYEDKNCIRPGFTLGALIFYLGLFFLPGIMGIGYSFTDWNAYSSEVNFVGWKNYLKVFEGGTNYGMFIKNTFLFTAVSSITKTTLGIALAILLTSRMVKMKSMHRMLVFLPQVMSFLIIGLVFKNILHQPRLHQYYTESYRPRFPGPKLAGRLGFAFKSILL